MTAFIFSGFKSKRLPRACSYCARNDAKVTVRHNGPRTVNNKTFRDPIVVTDALEGFCPSCYADLRTGLAAAGATIQADRRGRKPEQTPERVEHRALLAEMIEGFPVDDPFADLQQLASLRRQLAAHDAEIVG
jgi:hypothetical protein